MIHFTCNIKEIARGMRKLSETGVLTRHNHCNHCGEPTMHGARFGQRYCSVLCRLDGKAAEARAARKVWVLAGRPKEGEEGEHRATQA
jgi:predicted nucleic acid-binding Zn ribbon protein